MKLSVLDQTPVSNGQAPHETIQNTIELAQLVDGLGYQRIWYSEHHGSANFASASPEILIAHITSVTNQIRVGSGGIMLMHYSPLKMAEIFKTLTTLYPNRIDFGVGRAPGGDQFSILALHEGKQPNLFNLYDKLVEMMMFMSETMPVDHLYNRTLDLVAAALHKQDDSVLDIRLLNSLVDNYLPKRWSLIVQISFLRSLCKTLKLMLVIS